MEDRGQSSTMKASSLRWQILRRVFLHLPDKQSESGTECISRKTTRGFNLIPYHLLDGHHDEDLGTLSKLNHLDGSRDACVSYTLPVDGAPKIFLFQRLENSVDLNDFEISNSFGVDNTGLVCHWPSEDVLSYFCLSHLDMFRSKRVIELGSGYGLAGLVVATISDALEVVISDGNPQVVDYIRRNINANMGAFGCTNVKSWTLHWNHEDRSNISDKFDVIIASDCTFFKEYHRGLARTIKFLLNPVGPSEAIFFSPKRGDSLDKFLVEIKEIGLHFSLTENYDAQVWNRRQRLLNGDDSWPNYESDHCYPLLVRITL